MNETKVTINQKEYTIKKMYLGRYAALLEAIEGLPPEVTQKFAGLDKVSTEQFLGMLPAILAKSFPQAVKVLSVATEVPEEILTSEADLVDSVNLVKAVFEVNEYDKVKNVLVAAFKNKAQATATKDQKIG
jgi:hypothetical protein